MVIRRVKLNNFRSHDSFVLDCSAQTTKIVGRNGCGKTTLLEAIYETTQGKSFRAVDTEIVQRGRDFYRVELEYEDGRKTVVVYDGVKKEFLAEDKKTRRLPKKMKYPVVLFEPDDLHLVGTSPQNRRNYFDRIFGQLSEQYATALARYNKALKQRNELLKQDGTREADVFSWDVMLARYGTMLMATRRKMVEELNRRWTGVYHSIADNTDTVSLRYKTEVVGETEYLAKLEAGFQRDSLLGHTSYGVHRDSFDFVFNDVIADGSASRGEVRSTILAMKFIEAELIERILGKKPVVLLDDVFSELDKARQECLVTNFRENQVILTSVGDGELTVS